MNHSALKLLAMTVTAAAIAVSTAHANTQKWLGEYVPFDAAATEPQPDVNSSGPMLATRGESSKWLGENVRFDDAAEAPAQIAFEMNFPGSDVDCYSEGGMPTAEDSSEPPLHFASVDPLESP